MIQAIRYIVSIKSGPKWGNSSQIKKMVQNFKQAKRVLATTYVNSFLITLRLLIKEGKSLTAVDLDKAFEGIDAFDFSKYHSSQYKRMAEQIVHIHFGIKPEQLA